MRKRIISDIKPTPVINKIEWLDLDELAQIEITSEQTDHPIEEALIEQGKGWRASSPGEQIIRIIFDKPQDLHRIQLQFEEYRWNRTQEFVISWASDKLQPLQELVRQQWNFNPDTATSEIEDYQVALKSVSILELKINPDMNTSSVIASLAHLSLS